MGSDEYIYWVELYAGIKIEIFYVFLKKLSVLFLRSFCAESFSSIQGRSQEFFKGDARLIKRGYVSRKMNFRTLTKHFTRTPLQTFFG
jgi:hypothetical protein